MTSSGHLELDEDWLFLVHPHYPQRVILNSAGQSVPYDSSAQVADRTLRLTTGGWNGFYESLRVTDPPDLSAYAPDGGCLQGGCTGAPPYEANDNITKTDYGLSTSPNGPFTPTLKARPGTDNQPPDSSNTLVFYLKVPAQSSGDNFQVEVTKCDGNGNPLPQRVVGMSAVFTSWKRVYVERDHMFRRGGVIYALDNTNGDNIIPKGITTLHIYKGPGGAQIDNLSEGDEIAIFDTQSPFEGPHDTAYVGQIDRTSNPDYAIVPLVQADLTTPYATQYSYTASAIDSSTHYPNFDRSQGNCAGVGVIYSTVPDPVTGQTITDTDPNQLNGPGSAFYDADMRDIEQPFDDAYVEFVGLRSGMGAVPYVDESVPFYDPGTANGPETTNRLNFEGIWSLHGLNVQTPNYIYLLGCKGRPFVQPSLTAGISLAPDHYSYIYVFSLASWGQAQSPPFTPDQATMAVQYDSDHELGHQFGTNKCTTSPPCSGATAYHDNRSWWDISPAGCPASNPCLEEYSIPNPPTGTNRFCNEDLLLGDPNCSGTPMKPGAIRTDTDPLP